ncbi:hypothetical protein [Marivirga sp.]|uniref:DUF7282 domain-containing protein n=1 Tax=Marivirga sp. TaxID=2018662 RepID=UPI0025DC6857|nr:hypothetical protein [Marivirga sp.]
MMKMKKQNLKTLMKSTLLGIAASSLLFTACNNDEEEMMEPEMPTGMLTVSDQTISQNTIIVSNVNLDQDGWIVVHASEQGGPVVPDIISEPVLVEAGEANNVEVTLNDFASLSDGASVWVMLHNDDGEAGVYEFDGANGLDAPITTEAGDIVMSEITLSAPSVTVSNQVVSENKVVMEEVNAAVDGWIVIHEDNGEGNPGPVLGQTFVEAGSNSNVMIDLGNATFAGGEMLFPMLHVESPADGEYGFPDNGDGPEVFGDNVVVVGFETQAPTGSITAENQIVQGNTITVSDLTVDATAWVVVHASNEAGDGPEVPGIISTPVQLESGSNSNVQIDINQDNPLNGGDVIYIMIHTENGVIGEYEFDGANGFDGPITTQTITIEAPAGEFVANNQTVSQTQVVVESITVSQPSWVVVHRDNGNGSFVAPGIISEPVALEAGTTENVEISFTEELTDGETLWIMLHNDNGTVGSYEFDGANGFDNPITFSSIEISAPGVIAENQVVTNDMVTIAEVNAAVDGWIVIHEDNGDGTPGPVIGQTFVNAGINTDVMVDVSAGTVASGDVLFPMLHVEDPVDGEYGFPDNGDAPEAFNGNVVVVSFTVL